MMFLIRRRHAFPDDHHFVVSLVRIDYRCSDTGMGIDTAYNQRIDTKPLQQRVEISAIESAVTLLHDFKVGRLSIEFAQETDTECAFYRYSNIVLAHDQEGVMEIVIELLSDPNQGNLRRSCHSNKTIDFTRQRGPDLCEMAVDKEVLKQIY